MLGGRYFAIRGLWRSDICGSRLVFKSKISVRSLRSLGPAPFAVAEYYLGVTNSKGWHLARSAPCCECIATIPLWWAFGHWQISEQIRECCEQQDKQVGQCCKLLHLNWCRVLELNRAKLLFAIEQDREPQEFIEEHSHEEHFDSEETWRYEDLDLLSQDTHAVPETEPESEPLTEPEYSCEEHFDRDTIIDPESDFEVRYEGNCCWRGGVIIGYSSDCDWD